MKFILKKNFICIINFLYEYVLIFYEKKNDFVVVYYNKLIVNLIILEIIDYNFGVVFRL